MTDVTPLLSNYRECVRHLWNAYFRPWTEDEQDWDLHDEFADIASSIFSSLVLGSLGLTDMRMSPAYAEPEPLPGFRVIPGTEHGTPIMINRDPRSTSGYWDHPVKSVRPVDVDLQLLCFFDFDVSGYREFRYLKVIIRASQTYPDIIGRTALIEFEHAKVLLDDTSEPRT